MKNWCLNTFLDAMKGNTRFLMELSCIFRISHGFLSDIYKMLLTTSDVFSLKKFIFVSRFLSSNSISFVTRQVLLDLMRPLQLFNVFSF